MNLCDSGHDEICFDGYKCPLCAKIEEMSSEIDDLKVKVDELEMRVNDLITGQEPIDNR